MTAQKVNPLGKAQLADLLATSVALPARLREIGTDEDLVPVRARQLDTRRRAIRSITRVAHESHPLSGNCRVGTKWGLVGRWPVVREGDTRPPDQAILAPLMGECVKKWTGGAQRHSRHSSVGAMTLHWRVLTRPPDPTPTCQVSKGCLLGQSSRDDRI